MCVCLQVQIRPWNLSDSDFVMDGSQPLDPRKTIFVGGVPRPLRAGKHFPHLSLSDPHDISAGPLVDLLCNWTGMFVLVMVDVKIRR